MAILTVREDGSGNYTTVSAAIGAADPGDTIRIENTWSAPETISATISDDNLTIEAVGAAKYPGVYNASPTHYRARSTGGHIFTVNANGVTFDGIEAIQGGTGNSDEGIRFSPANATITVRDCYFWAEPNSTTQQDGFYCANQNNQTWNIENTIGVGWNRGGVHVQNTSAAVNVTVNIVSSLFYDCGASNTLESGGIVMRTSNNSSLLTCNVGSSTLVGSFAANARDFCEFINVGGGSALVDWNIEDCVYGSATTGVDAPVNSLSGRTPTDNPSPGAGDWVVFTDISSGRAAYDFNLQDSTENDAQDYHNKTVSAGLTIPTLDMRGVSRPQNTLTDTGPLEISAGGPSPITGTAAQDLQPVDQDATGTYTPAAITGTAAQNLQPIDQDATGAYVPVPITGAAAQDLQSIDQDASGSYTAPGITGTAEQELQPIDQDATGTYVPVSITGTAAQDLQPIGQDATGSYVPAPISGVIDQLLQPIDQNAIGGQVVADVIAVSFGSINVATVSIGANIVFPSPPGGGIAVPGAPVLFPPLVDEFNVSSVVLPAWDDSIGTAFLDDGAGNKRAIGWNQGGYEVSENGVTIEQYPPVWTDPPHTAATVYYVDATDGLDTNDGLSEGQAWQTLAKVNGSTFNAGDEVLFKRGETWAGSLAFPSSGSAANFIKIGAYGTGNAPTFDGASVNDVISSNGQSYLWFDQLEAFNSNASSTWLNGQFVASTGSSDLTFTGCVGRDGDGCGFFHSSGNENNIRFKDCQFIDNDNSGMNVGSGQAKTGWVIADCTISRNGKDPNEGFTACGIQLNAQEIQVYGCTIASNVNNSIPSFGGTSHGIYVDDGNGSSDIRIHNNLFSDHAPNGNAGGNHLKCESSMKAWHNVISDGSSDSRALQASDPSGQDVEVQWWNNVCDSPSFSSFRETAFDGGSFTIHACNNSTYQGGNGLLQADTGAGVSWTMRGNICTTTPRGFTFLLAPTADIDNTCLHNISFREYFWDGAARDETYWKTTLGFDVNGIETDPLYTDPVNDDFTLQAGSPCLSASVALTQTLAGQPPESYAGVWTGINYIPHATSPDMGAYQYLSGKTLNFSNHFLGRLCAGGIAGRITLWDVKRADLNELTGSGASNLLWDGDPVTWDGQQVAYAD